MTIDQAPLFRVIRNPTHMPTLTSGPNGRRHSPPFRAAAPRAHRVIVFHVGALPPSGVPRPADAPRDRAMLLTVLDRGAVPGNSVGRRREAVSPAAAEALANGLLDSLRGDPADRAEEANRRYTLTGWPWSAQWR
ncbi:hypothetical protein GCM10010211_73750 [Streptomyces albospinus]|uniref:Uncharacterized protein n=1 Tax=Streptomyces albospinus TaxID=285515 RepID=A0ABQ2VLX9_9ACTN|nr:hypothetical protein GCM10010211_73750 [Streptomyces albospinus]